MFGFTGRTQARRERRRALALLVVGSGLFPIGCGSSIDKAVEQTAEQTYEVDATGTFSLRNAAGAVRISGSDGASMKVTTTRKAWNPEQLNAIAARVSVQTNSVSIETSFPPQKTWRFSHRSGSVDYDITLPRTIKISRLEVENGDVLIEGMRGDVRADLVNGGLAARNCLGAVQLSVANGGWTLFTRNGNSGRLPWIPESSLATPGYFFPAPPRSTFWPKRRMETFPITSRGRKSRIPGEQPG